MGNIACEQVKQCISTELSEHLFVLSDIAVCVWFIWFDWDGCGG